MKYHLIFIQILFTSVLFSQAELVADINEGPEDSGVYCEFTFIGNQDCVVRLGDKYIFSGENETVGRELYVLDNGDVELITDLNNDPSDSDPQFMTTFGDNVYFIANDGTGFKIWRTNGSLSGTEIAFDLGVDDAGLIDYSVFLINGDELYFEFQGIIYVFDGQLLTEIQYDSGIFVTGSPNFNSKAWCSYKDGIAIMDFIGDSWDLIYIHDGLVDVLINFDTDDNSKAPHSMSAFSGGISFGFDASFDPDIEGKYLYLDGSNELIKQSDDYPVRSISVNNEACLVFDSNEDFTYFDANNLMGTQLLSGGIDVVTGSDWNRIVTGDQLVFQSQGGVFEDDRVSILNTIDGSVSTIFTGSQLKKLYSFGNHVIFFAEANFVDVLFNYDLNTEELNFIEVFPDLPLNPVLYPIGVQGEYFYFYGKLDDDIGTEVYRIAIDIDVATEDIQEASVMTIKQIGTNSFQLDSDIPGMHEVKVLTIDGQLIKEQSMSDKEYIEIPYSGLVCLHISNGNHFETQLKFVVNQ